MQDTEYPEVDFDQAAGFFTPACTLPTAEPTVMSASKGNGHLAIATIHCPSFKTTSTTSGRVSLYSSSSSSTSPIDVKKHRITIRNPSTLVQVLSLGLVVVVFAFQYLFPNISLGSSKSPSANLPTEYSPRSHLDPGICQILHPFHTKNTQASVSRPRKMALQAEAERVAAEFKFTDEHVQETVTEFVTEMNEGLAKNATNMSQIPTYVTGVPNGTEKGLYLAIDLGGTNFRVCSIQLNGDTTFNIIQEKVAIPKEMMESKTAKILFGFLAKQIDVFLQTHHNDHFEAHVRRRQTVSTPEGYRDEHIFRLGFTFSFPVHQVGINSGTLIRWTKGFNIPDAVGQDVCALLQKEIDLLRLPVRVAALVNDTVGTLMARSYSSPGKTGTLLGAIFGTGTNGAYVEKLSKITKTMEGEFDTSTGEMVVNTEWGSFDNGLKVLPNTKYDQILDRDSVNPGVQMFEKRISGMFLGEILRIVLVEMMKLNTVTLFKDETSSHDDLHSKSTVNPDSPLFKQWAVDSSILSYAESDNTAGLQTLRTEIEKSLGVSAPSHEDAQAVKTIAHAIAERAARLAGVAIGAIVLQTECLSATASTSEHASGPKSSGAILKDTKNLNISEAVFTTANKLADTAGLAVNEDEIVDIGVDGSLVEFYPGFEGYLRDALRVTSGIGPVGERKIRIGIAKDGSGVGAALIALVASKMEKQPNDYIGDLRRAALLGGVSEDNEEGLDFSPITAKSPAASNSLKP
ncbi:hypothetical protein BJ878DRAFT_576320 [Calycina marina]|uniref:glucokinase n=1 Tax=Calycina marina TaxID=1763456 RepID=A0A9P7Z1V5_9HELO|nr:hypothetical protein BJ878DRAFT_576320 [Calycina marina]